jgi:hypothetical protein
MLLAVVLAYVIPLVHNGVAPAGGVLGKWGPQCAVLAVLAVVNLIVGARLKAAGTKANVIAAWASAVASLIIFPIGTALGLVTMVHLVQGRSSVVNAT